MRKFIIQSKKGKTSIIEVEVEIISSLEDPSVLWLKAGEWRARILQPTSFHQRIEKVVDGKKEVVMQPDVWCWHSFSDSIEEAQRKAEDLIVQSFEFDLRKYGKSFTDEDVATAKLTIEIVSL